MVAFLIHTPTVSLPLAYSLHYLCPMNQRRLLPLFLLLGGLFIGGPQLRAQTLYWDVNGTTAGTGTTPSGTWDTSNVWSSDAAGAITTAAWSSAAVAVYSAGSDATGSYTVTVSGTQTIGGLTVEEGTPYFNGGSLDLPGATTFDITGNAIINSAITGTGTLTKTGNGSLTLDGASSYSGGTTITGGTLNATNNYALGSGPVTVSGSGTLSIDEYFLYSNSVQVNSGGRLAGNDGGYALASINAGGTLAPGTALTGPDAIGTLRFEDLAIGPNGAFEINVQSNGAGGFYYDQVSVTNTATLTINATPANRFSLKVISLDAAYALGDLGGLTPGSTYSWLIFQTNGIYDITSSSSTITPGSFLIDDSAFTTGMSGAGLFTVSQTGYNIYLNFTAVPEPSTYALMLAGLGLSSLAAWRKSRRSS